MIMILSWIEFRFVFVNGLSRNVNSVYLSLLIYQSIGLPYDPRNARFIDFTHFLESYKPIKFIGKKSFASLKELSLLNRDRIYGKEKYHVIGWINEY